MIKEITVIVPGEPIGKARPRWAKFGIYIPKKTVNYETFIREIFAIQHPQFEPVEDALRIEAYAFFSLPKTSRKKSSAMINGMIRPAKRPDIDNILKVCLDALQTIAFKNDSQVVECEIKKFYSRIPRIELKIKDLKEERNGN
jgi:Holliday junction resolvase RusA-like endonuclease